MNSRNKLPLLSICIPVYNGAKFVGQAIESLDLATHPYVEVVVCDDKSTDNSKKILTDLCKKYLNLIVFYNSKNLGFDRNMIEVVKRSRGKYCWYLGQDDYLTPGAVEDILKIISRANYPMIVTNFSRYQSKKIVEKRMVEGKSRLITNPKDLFLRRTRKSYYTFFGINLVYISILIFQKKFWLEALAKTPKRFLVSNYFHAFVATKFFQMTSKLYYFSKPIVVYRADNQRQWKNTNIWGYYNSHYVGWLQNLFGFNRLQMLYLKTVVWLRNSRPPRLVKYGFLTALNYF